MKKKIRVSVTLLLAGAVIVVCSYLLPIITEVKLKNEEVIKAAQVVAINEDADSEKVEVAESDVDKKSMDCVTEVNITGDPEAHFARGEAFSKQLECFVLTAKKAFKEEVGIELTDDFAMSAAMGGGTDLTLNWEIMESGYSNVYYGAIFSDVNLEAGTGNLVEVSVMGSEGSSIEEGFLALKSQASTAFREYLGVGPTNIPCSPHVEVRNGKKRVYLTWEEYDDSNDIMNFYEAWYEFVNQDNTEGKLVHLNHEIIPFTNTATKSMDADDVEMFEAAKKYASELGYHINELFGQYKRQDGSLMIYCFSIGHDRFDQLSIMLNEDGDLSGSTIGTDIKNYYIHDSYEEIQSKYVSGSANGEGYKKYYQHDVYEEIK